MNTKGVKHKIKNFLYNVKYTEFYEKIIRIRDIIIAILTLIVTFPIMLLISVIIYLDSPGPIIFRQIRIGKNRRYKERRQGILDFFLNNRRYNEKGQRDEDLLGRPFYFYKFRTMYVDAKERFPELYSYKYSKDEIEEIPFKVQKDPRLTRVGRMLRKTSLDELPNFINVILGDMSIVGPRPDIPEMMKYYKKSQQKKFLVKPGVTGLAQINGRGHLSFQDTIEFDIKYIKKRSFFKDILIMLKTIESILKRSGAF